MPPALRSSGLNLLALTLLLLSVPALAEGQILLEDDFADGDSAGWQTFASGWSEAGGVFQARNTAANTKVEAVWAPGFAWTDYVAEVDVTPLISRNTSGVSLLARYNSFFPEGSDAISCRFHQFNGTELQLLMPDRDLLRTPFSYSPGSTYRLRTTVSGRSVRCEVLDVSNNSVGAVLEATTTGACSGTVGLRSTHIPSDFDNLRVTQLPGAGASECGAVSVMPLSEIPIRSHIFLPGERTVDRQLYLFGELTRAGHVVGASDEIQRYDLTTGLWETLPFALPYELINGSHNSAPYLEGRFYLPPTFATGDAGGWGSHNRIIEVDLDLRTSQETTAFPYSRVWGLGSVEAGGRVYYFGGWTGGPQRAIFEFDPVTGGLVQVAQMIVASNEVVPTLGSDGWIYYWGRLHGGFGSRPIERFHPRTHAVEAMTSLLPAGIPHHPAYSRWHLPSENAIYLFQGRNGDGPTTPIYKFDYGSDQLTDTGLRLPSDLVNQRNVLDAEDPRVIYGYRIVSSIADRLELVKLTLEFNRPPVADAGPDQLHAADDQCEARVTLDGSASSDPDGDALTYTWSDGTATYDGVSVDLPLGPGIHIFRLTVADPDGASAEDEVTITVEDRSPPLLSLLGDNPLTLECATAYEEPGAEAVDACEGALPVAITGEVSAGTPGLYPILYDASDSLGNAAPTQERQVFVADTLPPAIQSVSASADRLWPPNHRMVEVSVSTAAADACDVAHACSLVSITSNEPVTGRGSGRTDPDWQILSPTSALLRAERAGGGSGRIYTLEVECMDAAGNVSTGQTQVHVPHDRR